MSTSAPAILILEDTRTVQNYIRDVLRPVESSHPILMARKLRDAQDIAANAAIAVFVVDIGLPDGDGIDFLCEMSLLHPDARALIITSTPTDDSRERARQLGVLHFLAKPLERKVLLDAVRNLLAPPDSSVGKPSGFEATLGGLSPIDIIHLKGLRGASGAVELREEHLFGRIWFDHGEVIHAECTLPGAKHEGIDAFRCMIHWRIGCIRDIADAPVARRTIRTPWQSLLLDCEDGTPANAAALPSR